MFAYVLLNDKEVGPLTINAVQGQLKTHHVRNVDLKIMISAGGQRNVLMRWTVIIKTERMGEGGRGGFVP